MSIVDNIKPVKDAVDNTVLSAVKSVENILPPLPGLPGMKGGLPALPIPGIPAPDLSALSSIPGLGPVYRKGPDEYPPIERGGLPGRAPEVDIMRFEGKY